MRFRDLPLGALALALAAGVAYRLDPSLVERLLPAPTPAAAAPAPPPFVMPVPVARVVKRAIPVVLDYAARTEAIRAISLQAKVSAYVVEQRVPDGSDVAAGDLIYRLDPRDFQVALDQARAQVERDQASLDYQKASYDRGDALSKNGWLAKDSLDQRTSGLHQAEAALQADHAAVKAAELNLAYTEIRAPFAGRLGRNQAAIGTLVGAGGTVLNSLVQIDPVYVTFNPSETDLVALAAARRHGTVPVEVAVPGEADAAPHKGELTFLDNSVDRATGTLVARATIANADRSLLPGQYVRATVRLGDKPDALLVPQVAIGSSQFGKFVFVVGKDERIEQRVVALGPSEGDLVSVSGDLAEGDRVVTGNLQKIGPGMPVKALDGTAPPA